MRNILFFGEEKDLRLVLSQSSPGNYNIIDFETCEEVPLTCERDMVEYLGTNKIDAAIITAEYEFAARELSTYYQKNIIGLSVGIYTKIEHTNAQILISDEEDNVKASSFEKQLEELLIEYK